MGWLRTTWEWLAKRPKPEAIANDVVAAVPFGFGYPRGSEFDVRRFVEDGYRRNVVIYAAISLISQSVSEPELVVRSVKDKKQVPYEHPLSRLLARPNPEYTKFTLFETSLIHLLATGVSYLHKGRNRAGQTIRLTPLRTDRMLPIPAQDGHIESYEYNVEGVSRQIITADDVMRVILPDPLDDYNGLSPIVVCSRFGDIDNETANFLRDFFINGAVPGGLLKLKTPARPEERLRISQQWNETYGRSSRRDGSAWHTVGVINSDVEYEQISYGPDNLKLDSVWGITETRICAAFGVPPAVIGMRIGLQLGNKYSNYLESVKSFWQQTLMPLYARYDEELTLHLAHEFDVQLEVVFDLKKVTALQESIDDRLKRASSAYGSGLMTRDEARNKFLDEEPMKDVPDVIVIPQLAVAVEAAKEKLLAPPTPVSALPPAPAPAEADREDGDETDRPDKVAASAGKVLPFEKPGAESQVMVPVFEGLLSARGAAVQALKPSVAKGLVRATQIVREGVQMADLIAAIKEKNVEAAAQAIPWERWKPAYKPILKVYLRSVVLATGKSTYGPRFREDDPRLENYLETRVEAESERMSQDGWLAIRDAISSAIEQGFGAEHGARLVRAVVGLTRPQAAAVLLRA